MIKYVAGDIFQSKCEAITNPVNCVGVMGSGLALAFKERYPENFDAYKRACETKELHLSKSFFFELAGTNEPKWIVNFPTKLDWKNPSKIAWIRFGLLRLAKDVAAKKIKSIAIPKLGCGKGGLDWTIVKPIIEEKFGKFPDVVVEVYI